MPEIYIFDTCLLPVGSVADSNVLLAGSVDMRMVLMTLADLKSRWAAGESPDAKSAKIQVSAACYKRLCTTKIRKICAQRPGVTKVVRTLQSTFGEVGARDRKLFCSNHRSAML